MNTDMIAFEAEMKRLRGAYIMDIAPACEMYRAALARVAELESQLAAQGWRPGSETPKHDWYLVYDFSEDDQPLFRYYGPAGWRLSGDRVIPNWYMPIPPLPPAPQETE